MRVPFSSTMLRYFETVPPSNLPFLLYFQQSEVGNCLSFLFIKVGLSPFKKLQRPLNMIKNAIYFTLKALFILKIFNFCLDFLVM